MKKTYITFILAIFLCHLTGAQSKIVRDFTPVCDSLSTMIAERIGIKGELKLKTIMKRGGSLDFYFTESLSDFPWRKEDVRWFRSELKNLFPENYSHYKVGEILSRNVPFGKLVTPNLSFNGKHIPNSHKVRPHSSERIVTEIGASDYPGGLSGRHIALWQSHGRYYDQNTEMWTWQRPCLFQTCEDMFTQGFVLPYLVPMLENAGAYVLLPRERDVQTNEVIADNDPMAGSRGCAAYVEKGRWEDAGSGFADTKQVYTGTDNPFTMGTARQTLCVGPSYKPTSSIIWQPEIPERGEYAVYVSYKTLPSSTKAAHYTVHHMGGSSEYAVNQKMGGGTWTYLGTFEFDKGKNGYVTLDNGTPKGHRLEVGAKVTADAVRFGGGMGNIARNGWIAPDDTVSVHVEPTLSGMPRSAEGARYWLQWAGADTCLFHQNDGRHDYRDDYMSRGDWSEWISRRSRMNPKGEGGLGIPVDLTFAFHTDAGTTPNDSLIGTLAIYTYKSERKTVLPTGESRLTSRMFADIVQSQIVHDLQSSYDTLWARRCIWDRGYRESRTPSSPSMLLELLSHQNFADMKYGLDPAFRFDVSRAVYKGMLKYLSNRYGCEYTVQPLPVRDMSVEFGADGKAVISWKPVEDRLEPTASPMGYIIYKRTGDGGFDKGTVIKEVKVVDGICYHEADITPGEVVSFKVSAYNDGGVSFPSETVSIGLPLNDRNGNATKKVLIVNNFDRISGPAWFDSGSRAGFDNSLDSGVPYIRDITYVGEMYNFNRDEEWISNDRPGFGASYSDMAGQTVAGNTFDFAAVHGKAILEAGFPFYSCSNERFCNDSKLNEQAWTVDLICGKQVTTTLGMQQKYTVFDRSMQKALKEYTAAGGNVLVSGSYIGTDIWDRVYPVSIDSTFRAESAAFAGEVLGYKFVTGQASRRGIIRPAPASRLGEIPVLKITKEMNPRIYCVESPDGISPAGKSGQTIYRYADSGISAGVAFEGNGYRCVSLGFPIEVLEEDQMIEDLMTNILKYFNFADAEKR